MPNRNGSVDNRVQIARLDERVKVLERESKDFKADARGSYYFTEPCINTTAYENTIHGIQGDYLTKRYEKKEEEDLVYELDYSLDQEEFLCLHF